MNRQGESLAREGIDLGVPTIADWLGICTAMLALLVQLIDAHALAAARLHGDDTTVPLLARDKTNIVRVWTYDRRTPAAFAGWIGFFHPARARCNLPLPCALIPHTTTGQSDMRSIKRATLVAVLACGLSACGQTTGDRALSGGGLGAAGGAAVGALTGTSVLGGAAIGGAAGAATGALTSPSTVNLGRPAWR